MTDTQPEALAAFLACAEHHILQAPHGSDEDAGESLISAGCYYAPRLLAAVEAALKLADKLEPQAPPSSALEEDRMWIRQECAGMIREVISCALLGEGE